MIQSYYFGFINFILDLSDYGKQQKNILLPEANTNSVKIKKNQISFIVDQKQENTFYRYI